MFTSWSGYEVLFLLMLVVLFIIFFISVMFILLHCCIVSCVCDVHCIFRNICFGEIPVVEVNCHSRSLTLDSDII